jgi:hypothetical protein
MSKVRRFHPPYKVIGGNKPTNKQQRCLNDMSNTELWALFCSDIPSCYKEEIRQELRARGLEE